MKRKKKVIRIRDTRGNESFAIRISLPTKDYSPIIVNNRAKKGTKTNVKVRKNA